MKKDISVIMEGLEFVLADKSLVADYNSLEAKVVSIQERLSAGELSEKDAPAAAIDLLLEALELSMKAAKSATNKAKIATNSQTVTQAALVTARAEKARRVAAAAAEGGAAPYAEDMLR